MLSLDQLFLSLCESPKMKSGNKKESEETEERNKKNLMIQKRFKESRRKETNKCCVCEGDHRFNNNIITTVPTHSGEQHLCFLCTKDFTITHNFLYQKWYNTIDMKKA